MVNQDFLKSVGFFEEMSEEILEGLSKLADLREYKEGEYLNKRKRSADYFYIILEGSISLELEDITGKMTYLETLMSGAALGFSSLIEVRPREYLTDARVLTPTKAIRFRASDLSPLFYQNYELGFLMMKRIALIAQHRLIYRTHPIGQVANPQSN